MIVPAEYSAKLLEDVFHAHAATAESATTSATKAGTLMTVLVVTTSFFSIAQHFVGLSCFLKFIFRLRIARILIRVIFNGHFAVSFLDVFRTGIPAYPQYVVIISFCGHIMPLQVLLRYRQSIV